MKLQWYEPAGYEDWRYNQRGGAPKLSRIALVCLAIALCVASNLLLSFEFRMENEINVLEVIIALPALGYLGFHLYAWLNSKFDFITKEIEKSEDKSTGFPYPT